MTMTDTKSKQQKAAERAELLENMTDDEKAIYRKRKTYVSMNHDWKNFFETMKAEDLKELIIAIINYDETGEMPKLKNPANFAVFVGFIKKFLDTLFDDWCVTCYTASSKGGKGGKAKAINAKIVDECIKYFQCTDILGVPITELVKNDGVGWNKLARITNDNTIQTYKNKIAEIRKQCESEYQNE